LKKEGNRKIENNLVNVYVDESRYAGHRYMILGGVWIPAE